MADNGTLPVQAPSRPYASVQDFRARIYRDVTLPSGLLVQIRAVQSFDMMSAWDLPLPSSGAGDASPEPTSRETIHRGMAWRDAAILHGCVWPPFVPRGAGTDAALGLEELGNGDYEALFQAILRHSGMAPEVAETIEAFRPDPERPAGGAAGREVSRPAASGAADDPGGVVCESAPGAPGHHGDARQPLTSPASPHGEPAESFGAV